MSSLKDTYIETYGVVGTENKVQIIDKLSHLGWVSNDRVMGILGAPSIRSPRVIFAV